MSVEQWEPSLWVHCPQPCVVGDARQVAEGDPVRLGALVGAHPMNGMRVMWDVSLVDEEDPATWEYLTPIADQDAVSDRGNGSGSLRTSGMFGDWKSRNETVISANSYTPSRVQ